MKLSTAKSLPVSFALLAGCTAGYTDHLRVDSPQAQLFDGLGTHRRVITTASAEAQRYFDQGLAWMYSFNHDEAIRSFARAAELDPAAAMPWWGISLCEGPNYNDPVMTDQRSAAAFGALREARARLAGAAAHSDVERALIGALGKRYEKPWPRDRAPLDRAYAGAMAEVSRRFPHDSDVGTLYAESLMVLRPWKLYDERRQPEADTPKIVAALEQVLAIDPGHPGANHLYIHAVEPSTAPDRAVAAADRLSSQVPASGHMNHMPSHIYIQVGQWQRSIEQNSRALDADSRYRDLSPDQGLQHMYMAHNAHMLAYSAMMAGREAEAMAAARALWENLGSANLGEVAPYVDLWMTSVYDVQKRFGRWDEILAEPPPSRLLPITTAVWRAHRAVALAAKRDFSGAEREQAAFRAARAAIPQESVFSGDPTHRILEVSEHFVAGEIALQQGDWAGAARHLERAVEAEDALSYGEPPQWLQPTRHTLGAVYLMAGRHQDAERVYREDLAHWRENGWSLYGLGRALMEQGKVAEAEAVLARHRAAWARADEPTRTSCKCIAET